MKKLLFIVNPVSGSGNGYAFYKKYLENNPAIDKSQIIFTEFRGHATQLSSKLSSQYENIVVCGGDGTFNEVINGVHDLSKTNIGIIAVGSGNDFIRNFSQTRNYATYLDKLFKSDFQITRIDLGIVNFSLTNNPTKIISRLFANSCGIGFDAYVAYLNQNSKIIKGKLSYIYSILKGLLKLRSIQYKIRLNNINIEGNLLILAVGNGKTAGGGLYLTPNAIIDDNMLDFTCLEKVSRIKLVFNLLPKALFNKISESEVIRMGKINSASISLKYPYYIHTDGEALSDIVTNLELSIHDKKLRFIKI